MRDCVLVMEVKQGTVRPLRKLSVMNVITLGAF